MSFHLNKKELEHLRVLKERSPEDIIELCKCAFDYLNNGPNDERYLILSKKYNLTRKEEVQESVEALISLLIAATKANVQQEEEIHALKKEIDFNEDVLEILAQFVTSKRNFIEGSIKSANLRSYRLVNLEWRLEAILASRALMQQRKVIISMKFYLHMEPKNENRELLKVDNSSQEPIHADERRNRKDLMVQTDVSSLLHIIRTLEDALEESRSRRIRNLISALS